MEKRLIRPGIRLAEARRFELSTRRPWRRCTARRFPSTTRTSTWARGPPRPPRFLMRRSMPRLARPLSSSSPLSSPSLFGRGDGRVRDQQRAEPAGVPSARAPARLHLLKKPLHSSLSALAGVPPLLSLRLARGGRWSCPHTRRPRRLHGARRRAGGPAADAPCGAPRGHLRADHRRVGLARGPLARPAPVSRRLALLDLPPRRARR